MTALVITVMASHLTPEEKSIYLKCQQDVSEPNLVKTPFSSFTLEAKLHSETAAVVASLL